MGRRRFFFGLPGTMSSPTLSSRARSRMTILQPWTRAPTGPDAFTRAQPQDAAELKQRTGMSSKNIGSWKRPQPPSIAMLKVKASEASLSSRRLARSATCARRCPKASGSIFSLKSIKILQIGRFMRSKNTSQATLHWAELSQDQRPEVPWKNRPVEYFLLVGMLSVEYARRYRDHVPSAFPDRRHPGPAALRSYTPSQSRNAWSGSVRLAPQKTDPRSIRFCVYPQARLRSFHLRQSTWHGPGLHGVQSPLLFRSDVHAKGP